MKVQLNLSNLAKKKTGFNMLRINWHDLYTSVINSVVPGTHYMPLMHVGTMWAIVVLY